MEPHGALGHEAPQRQPGQVSCVSFVEGQVTLHGGSPHEAPPFGPQKPPVLQRPPGQSKSAVHVHA